MRILFVCTGNTCRSPMAKAIFKNKTDHEVQSAGVYAGFGQPASDMSLNVLREDGIELKHESQPVTDDLLEWADLILTMTKEHKRALDMQFPHYSEKSATLGEYVQADKEEAWEKLKKDYSDLEAIKLAMKQENAHGDPELGAAFKEKLQEIEKQELILSNQDISDPFGGSYDTYKKTFDELNKYLDLLAKKLDNR